MGQEVKIKIRAFPYYTDEKDPVTGNDVRREHLAFRGDTVELSDEDLARAEKFDAIYKEGETETEPDTDPESVEALAEWIKTAKPNVDEVVDRANGDPVLANKLLEAENLATGQQPRTTLEEDLLKIVNAEGDDN